MSQLIAMVMSGRSVHQTTLFSWTSLTKRLTSTSYIYLFLNQRKEMNGRRNYFMINLHESMGPGRDRTHDPLDVIPTALPGPVYVNVLTSQA